ncbi:unnamed protein product [Ophioblennius macclurei]
MGVHELWSILEPIRQSVPLYSLSGKTLAVDLSLWVCEAQHVQAMMGRVTKPHLRNLFFRVSSLTLMGVKLVFVMEGEAPKIKAETMSKRTQVRYGGFKKAAAPKAAANPTRGRFKAVLRECAEMLDYLGVPWVTAAGEAEAMCAYLDSQGLVDGCITNDGDAFLYGARTVYRNFNMNTKDPQVDCYQTTHVQSELHLSRENLVGLAILLGCDYIPKGIPGVGKEQALRLIQTLKGQSLLQRFTAWREEITDVSEGVVKKVSHCNICRHPGSAKAHERGGCTLCNSQRFCQPRDFDYQCPCDWHRGEKTRQELSLEANVRRRTLASQQFPFTEIISEFLVSKDKPVSHFKRRQPNMLLMQKFAYDKMEWPKHYTSEKILILMTYSELMNRKYGREASSQVKPIRILKPRVRNGIACFEVIWSSPEHFVFPEDQQAGDQHEVRTVEEESLFRVAFPEVVESYLRDKALAEESKTKKKKSEKKSNSKKEKPVEASEGISHLMAQMTLQSSSAAQASAQPLLPIRSATIEAEVVILDTPVSHKQLRKEKEEPGGLHERSDAALSHAHSETVASPSVSVVVDALHLSDIDWDAFSFTSSPAAVNHTAGLETRSEKEGQTTSSDAQQGDAELSVTECSLRDRLLMKNSAKTISQIEVANDKVPLADKTQQATKNVGREALEEHKTSKSKTNEKPHGSKKPPQKHMSVKTAVASSAAPAKRCHSDPVRDNTETKVLQTTKKSVCISLCSSSDDSDAENHPTALRRTTKAKPSNNNEKLCSVPTAKPHAKTTNPHSSKPDAQILKGASVATENTCQDVDEDVFLQTPASPAVLEEGDSVICVDSPLPLAERLRLKFNK